MSQPAIYSDVPAAAPLLTRSHRPANQLRPWHWLLLVQLLLTLGVLLLLALAPRPFPTKLIHWDAEWYTSIRAHGYFFRPDAKSSVAFFPLFPLLWRGSHLGALGISLLNLALAVGAGVLLWLGLRLRPAAVVLFTALPSSFFLYIPYTEALFFAFTALVLVLLVRQPRHGWLLALALFGAALTRVSAFFYLPALAVAEGLLWLREPTTWLVRLRRLFACGLAVGTGLVTVLVYQWQQTGVWFAFNKAEEQWHPHMQLPHLPFISTTENDGALWLDGLALLVGLTALGWLARLAWRALQLRERAPAPDYLLIIAAAYVAIATVQVVLQAPVEGGHSSLMSLNRYIFCTPFFVVLLDRLLTWRLSPHVVLPALAAVLALTVALGMFTAKQFNIEWPTSHLPLLWGPVAGWAYAGAVLGYAALWLRSGTRTGRVLVYASSLALQFLYLYTYAVGHWVG